MTLTKKARTLVYDVVSKDIYKNPTPLASLETENRGNCIMCNQPVTIAPGQIMKTYVRPDGTRLPMHKQCRRDFKRMKEDEE